MLMPKRLKYRKQFRGRMRGLSYRGSTVAFGDFGLLATEPVWLTARQIEACRRTMTRFIKRKGNIYIRVFPDKPVTQKAAETRMGSGKGSVEFYVAVIRPGRVLFEIGGVDEATAREALRLAGFKLPCKSKIVQRIDPISGVARELTV